DSVNPAGTEVMDELLGRRRSLPPIKSAEVHKVASVIVRRRTASAVEPEGIRHVQPKARTHRRLGLGIEKAMDHAVALARCLIDVATEREHRLERIRKLPQRDLRTRGRL